MNDGQKMRLKVCGMRLEENILDVANIMPDYMGFIFFKGSKRFVGENFLMPSIPLNINRVGVFVNESGSEIRRIAKMYRLGFIQLHGNESPEFCRDIHDSGLKVIKVFLVGDDFDFQLVNPYKKFVDYFLFDAKGDFYGGNGVRFNWGILKRYDQEIPFFLSGGIGPQNISGVEELRGMNLYGLDVNSGVERGIGVKDIVLIKDLISKIDSVNKK